ncbi:MAG: sensor histidine kinase [Lachnospiraceae bacterium]|jgi:Predicted signal transduction protein with a C-terminal ATPase domain|nr:sensor histidine kinase [Lachnospiraceae bacterium]
MREGTKNRLKKKLGRAAEKIPGNRLGYRMFLVYIFGGFLPLVLIGLYLIQGTKQILVNQAKSAEAQELFTVRNQIAEMQDTITIMSRYFYFDEKLEEIAEKQYRDYQEIIDDYRSYTSFLEYRKYYNDIISRISVYFENDTITGNSEFVKVDDNIRNEEWYQRVQKEKGSVIWSYLPHEIMGYDHALALSRMLKTRKGKNVGALVIYIRPERFEGYVRERSGDTFLVLNGETSICSMGQNTVFEDIKEYLPGKGEEDIQKQISIDGASYIVTTETIFQDNSSDYLQVVGVRAYRDILKEANAQSIKSIGLSCLSAGFAVIMILSYSLSFSRRVQRFKEQMKKAAEGSFELQEKLGGNDEISELYDYLHTMIHDIQRLLAEVYREKIHAEQLKTSQKDAELKLLTSQINPHFLYNTLETIRMKARVSKQYEIEDLVKMLGKILRSSISAGEKEVSVASEVELVESYLKIQKYRFGERMAYEIFVEEGVEKKKIIPLILQPIVENSIIHGFEGREETGHIQIRVEARKEDLVILVEDDGNGIEGEKLAQIREELKYHRFKGKHIGVCNVNQRIKLKFGDGYGVEVESRPGEKTVVKMRLPLDS